MASTTSSAIAACGVGRIRGVQVRKYCGTADARVTTAAETSKFSGGRCEVSQQPLRDWYFVYVGTATLSSNVKPIARYFELAVDMRRAGTYSAADATVLWTVPGKLYHKWRRLSVTVAPGLRQGTFSGVLRSGKIAKGSWRC
jgi:hypothetical protein